jgi:RNA polymerase-binding transcription factor DksA
MSDVPADERTDPDTDHQAHAPEAAVVSEAAEVVAPETPPLDLDAVERDLADVELALARLDSGEYWTDEVTGAPIPDDELAAHPTARRAGGR